jgi:hypothetical protein
VLVTPLWTRKIDFENLAERICVRNPEETQSADGQVNVDGVKVVVKNARGAPPAKNIVDDIDYAAILEGVLDQVSQSLLRLLCLQLELAARVAAKISL